ncbi:MAG: aminotransferase class I/II-fold pyridoxal phosphate-dependent enzyme, partial [Candidatus Zixiibacteriota bacterium]
MTTATRTPARFIPYGRQHITEQDIAAVVDVLKSDWLTQGPGVPAFEQTLKDTVGAEEAVACANGTAALHLAMLALGIGPGDVVVTTPITFLATANCARYVDADVQFVDIDPVTGLMDIAALRQHLKDDRNHRVKAIIPVHFAGQPVDLPAVRQLADEHGAYVIDDACHAIGAEYECAGKWYRVGCGAHSDLTVFSFHPVKHVAMGEGGAVTTGDARLAVRLRQFRNHGIERDARRMVNKDQAFDGSGRPNPWYYEMHKLGFNYRLTDIQAALGTSQLNRLEISIRRRRELALL